MTLHLVKKKKSDKKEQSLLQKKKKAVNLLRKGGFLESDPLQV